MTDERPSAVVAPTPHERPVKGPAQVAAKDVTWYQRRCRRLRILYWSSEVILLAISAAVPVSVALVHDGGRTAAILGGLVVIVAGLRPIFHWRDDWIRFTGAITSITSELRLYDVGGAPYDKAETRDVVLTKALNRIEELEAAQWSKLAAPDTGTKSGK